MKSALSPHRKNANYIIKLHGHNTPLNRIAQGQYVLFFLRQPLSRFVSGFYSRKRQGLPRYNAKWSSKEKEIFSAFQTPNQLGCALAQKDDPNHLLAVDTMNTLQHFTKYQYWYKDLVYFQSRLDDIFYIGFQKSLDSDFNHLKALMGLPETVSLPQDDKGAHRNPTNLDKALEEPAISALNTWFSEDLIFYKQCQDFMNQRKSELNSQ